MRTYEGKIKLPQKNITNWRTSDLQIKKREMFGIRRGLKIVHIGDGVWRIGKERYIKNKGLHQVIYSPEGKEYHIWNDDVNSVHGEMKCSDYDGFISYDDHGNFSDEAKVKVYIMTNILDDKNNWCFDLNILPKNGKLKVIYNNGTIKNIDFNGVFEKVKILKGGYYVREILPVGYRLPKVGLEKC